MIRFRPFVHSDSSVVPRTWPDQIADFAPSVATPEILRRAVVGAIAANGFLSLIELWRIVLLADPTSARYAAFATAATIGLHLRHVTFGLRSERPPAGPLTLAALVIVNVAAAVLVGRLWALQFASVGVSVLIVVRGPAAPLAVAATILSPLLLGRILASWQSDSVYIPIAVLSNSYLVCATAWRTVTLYVPVQLVAIIRRLDAARRSLESRAVIETRSLIERDLRSGLELALQRIIADGERARQTIRHDPGRASAQVHALVNGSRRALADARGLTARYWTPSLRAELEAASSLLQAAGSRYRVLVASNVPMDAAGLVSDGAIRAAVARALEDAEQKVVRVINVALDEAGRLRLDVMP